MDDHPEIDAQGGVKGSHREIQRRHFIKRDYLDSPGIYRVAITLDISKADK